MVTKINYNDIKHLTLNEIVEHLTSIDKSPVKDVNVIDLFYSDALHQPFAKTYYKELFMKGVYLFYDSNNNIRYIGQTNSGYFTRLMAQADTTPSNGYGWNSMLRIMGGKRTGKNHNDLLEEDHDVDWEEMFSYKLVLIEVPYHTLIGSQIVWLEKYLLKAYRVIGEQTNNRTLLNSGIGWPSEENWHQTMEQLLVDR